MKIKKFIFWMLTLLPFVVVMVALPFLPDQIPAHYGINGEVTRWGSKYETLIFPFLTLFLSIILFGSITAIGKKEKYGKNNEKVMVVGNCSLLLLNGMTYFFLYLDFIQVRNLSFSAIDINQLLFGLLGVCLVVIGNIMPKVRRNSLIGLRTRWSMKNDITWKASQRFGGITLMIVGVLMILIVIFMKGIACLLCSMVLLILVMTIDIIYSYRIAKKYGTNQQH